MVSWLRHPRTAAQSDWAAGHAIAPLIDGVETFSALERAIAGATRTVHLAYWSFDPDLPLADDGVAAGLRDGGGRPTWGDLVRDAATRGVSVRILISDVDPILTFEHHRSSIAAMRRLNALGRDIAAHGPGTIQAVADRHPARVGWLVRLLGTPIASGRLNDLLSEANRLLADEGPTAAADWLADLPGAWPAIAKGRDGWQPSGTRLPAWIASHHEKIGLIDGETAFLGGLDIDVKRADSGDHDAPDAWHDVACRLTGPAVANLEREFRVRWNREISAFQAVWADARPPDGVKGLSLPKLTPLEEGPPPDAPAERDPAGEAALRAEVGDAYQAEVQVWRTRSRSRASFWHRTAKPVVTDIAAGLEGLLETAQRSIYVETQFLRDPWLVRRLVRLGRRRRALRLIVVLPLVPEPVSLRRETDAGTAHGQRLQARALDRLRRAFGDRFAVYTMLRNAAAPADSAPQARLAGSDMVYVHAKAMVIDDRVAVLGSANLNGRSLWCDSETAIAWRGPDVPEFRRSLWRRMFALTPEAMAETPLTTDAPAAFEWWRRTARANLAAAPGTRLGFVVPLPPDAALRAAKWSWVVPSEVV